MPVLLKRFSFATYHKTAGLHIFFIVVLLLQFRLFVRKIVTEWVSLFQAMLDAPELSMDWFKIVEGAGLSLSSCHLSQGHRDTSVCPGLGKSCCSPWVCLWLHGGSLYLTPAGGLGTEGTCWHLHLEQGNMVLAIETTPGCRWFRVLAEGVDICRRGWLIWPNP